MAYCSHALLEIEVRIYSQYRFSGSTLTLVRRVFSVASPTIWNFLSRLLSGTRRTILSTINFVDFAFKRILSLDTVVHSAIG